MGDAFDFSPKRDLLYEQVADRIQQMIVQEALHPGDRLPGERDLAERMSVSRSVIREAMRVLKVRGLIEVRSGSGTYVQELGLGDVSAPIGLLLSMRQVPERYGNLLEVRCTLEVAIAGVAARRATAKDVATMEAAIAASEASVADGEQFIGHDLAFHAALAVATHNELYSVLLAPIADLSFEFRMTTYRYDAEGTVNGARVHHRRILDRIKARDPEGAREAMRAHLDQAEALIGAAHAYMERPE
jgi:GntR family transcriptional repressor for pyruvate dehydrogenase complex